MSLKIGVIGTGFIGDLHLSCFKKIADAEVIGIVEKNENKRTKISKKYDINGYKDLSNLFNQRDPDIIDICLPTPLHKEFIEKSVNHVDTVICEKPISRTLSEAKYIKQLSTIHDLDLYVGHVVRFFPEYVNIREQIKNGKIGEAATVRTFRGGAPPSERAGWYTDLKKSGGILVDLLIHDFDWLRWTIGEIDSVYTQGLSFEEGDQDLALVNLSFENGSIGHVEGSWAHPQDFPFTTRVEIAGDKGLIDFDSQNSTPLTTYTSQEGSEAGTSAPKSPLAKNPWCVQLEHFLDCIQGDKEPRVTLDDSIEALKISLSALKSLKKDRPIKVGDYDAK